MFKLLLILSILFSNSFAGWKWSLIKNSTKITTTIKVGKKAFKIYKKNNKYFKKVIVKGRTVYQQKINPKLKTFNKTKGKIETNLEKMKKGESPYIIKNGKKEQIQLHHSRQNDNKSLFELSKKTHLAKKGKGKEALHPYGRKKNPINPVPKIRKEFNKERRNYWKNRAKEFDKGK